MITDLQTKNNLFQQQKKTIKNKQAKKKVMYISIIIEKLQLNLLEVWIRFFFFEKKNRTVKKKNLK